MTINQVIVDVLLFAIASFSAWAIKTYLIPFLKDQHLEEIAKIVVNAAESLMGAGCGSQKLQYCIDQIQNKYKVNIDIQQITNAIESAWMQLNNTQIDLGIKQAGE